MQAPAVRICGRDETRLLGAHQDSHQGREIVDLPSLPVRDRVQASPRVSHAQSHQFQTIQVSQVQLFMRQQIHTQLAHEISLKRLSGIN